MEERPWEGLGHDGGVGMAAGPPLAATAEAGRQMPDLRGRTIVAISDVHLGFTKEGKLHKLKALLEDWLADHSFHVLVMGDFLDLWRADDATIVKQGSEAGLWASLEALAKDGRLSYVVGNHDYRIFDHVFCDRLAEPGEADFAELMGLHEGNVFHRYLAFDGADRRWLACHGDEANFGYGTRKVLGVFGCPERWQEYVRDAYLFFDQMPRQIISVWDIYKRYSTSLRKLVVDVTATALSQGSIAWAELAPVDGEPVSLSAIGDVAPPDPAALRDAFMAALRSEFEGEAGTSDADEARRGLSALEGLGLPADAEIQVQEALEDVAPQEFTDSLWFSLGEVPPRLTESTARDSSPVEVSFPPIGVIIGHRHDDEVLPVPPDTVVVDCGSWEKDSKHRVCYLHLDDSGPQIVPL